MVRYARGGESVAYSALGVIADLSDLVRTE
jgi:hypothetical protein